MKIPRIILLFVAEAAFLFMPSIKANDYSFVHPKIEKYLWDQASQGLAIALVLSQQNNDPSKHGYLEVYIHNTSDKPFRFNPNQGICGVKVFYIKNNEKIPIRDFRNTDNSEINNAHLSSGFIKPSQILRICIDLTPSEMALIRANPVICGIPVYIGFSRVESGTIETTPRILK